MSLHIPPLRQRKEEIESLAREFIRRTQRGRGRGSKTPVLSKEVISLLLQYPWPGNIRELENKIQQLVVMALTSIILNRDIKLLINRPISQESKLEYFNEAKKRVINDFEKTYLSKLLIEHKGDMVAAARRAGKTRTTLWDLLRKHNLSPKQFQ